MFMIAIDYNAQCWDASLGCFAFWYRTTMACYSAVMLGPFYLETVRRDQVRKKLKLFVNAEPPYSGMTRISRASLYVVR